ncbi:MAG: alpha/beta hydrolase, partial [Alteromonas sp.]|nr:alpha/beta hydrolase [Alteromonas sp.]
MQAWHCTLSQGNIQGLTNGKSGPLILGLHGFLDNAASLACLFPYFDDYQFIAISLRGHGKSFHRSLGAHYDQLDLIHDIHVLVEVNDGRVSIL